MINIPIDKRREYLKKIYNALNSTPIARAYTPDKIKDIAITSEYECCENSKMEQPGANRPLRSRPTPISNSQVFFGGAVGDAGAFSLAPGVRVQKAPQCHAGRPDPGVNGMYMSRAPDPGAKMGPVQVTMLGRYSGYSTPHAGGHMPSQGDFMFQCAPGLRSYQTQDYAVPQLQRRPETHPGGAQPCRKWDMHERDISGLLHGTRAAAPTRSSVPRGFEDARAREKERSPDRAYILFGEPGFSAHGGTPRPGPFPGTAVCPEGGSAPRPGCAGADVLQRGTKEDMFKAPHSYARGKTELQAQGAGCKQGPAYAESVCYSYGPQCAKAPPKPCAEGSHDAQAAGPLGAEGLGSEVLEFDLGAKLEDVALGDSEKNVIRSKLHAFREELLAIEADAAGHAGLGCSPELSSKLEATCKIVRAQMEYIKEHKYFLREVFLDVAIERIRKYAALARGELESAQKSTETYDFAKVCEKVAKAFRKMKSADSSFVFCIDPP
ncbi:UNVERIFIED_CONTAM: hypothetical protein PYX00_011559 [Menopon gallinae]|uniref:Uncharacterized protein n=1 Tax=Menopon gallinae TaxID=328185 RepID=A0AAW2H811_9NEOP